MPPIVVLAPDKFKGSLGAVGVAERLAAGIRRVVPEAELRLLPVADGGDGTVDAAVAGGARRIEATVSGPTGEPVAAALADHPRGVVVELAQASGLVQLPGGRLEPLAATSRGTGELIARALDTGASVIVLGLGGSACTDGGAGMVQALGARLLDADGRELPPGGGALARLDRIDVSGLDPRLAKTELVIASDVDNPLLGLHGAAAVYGPQKGADTPELVAELDGALARLAEVAARDVPSSAGAADRPGAGAAGGVGFGALAFLGARVESGIGLLLDVLDFPTAVAGADLVVTGEGRLDAQTLHGKAPAGVAAAARAAGARVAAVAGVNELSAEALAGAGIEAAFALLDVEPDPAICMAEPGRLLETIGEHLARTLLVA